MKNVLKTGLIVTIGFIAACGGNQDKVTGSKSLTAQITGKYARTLNTGGVSSYDGKPFTTSLKDTIILIEKDGGFEVQNRYWKKITAKDGTSSDPNGEYGKGDTYQGTFNIKDTTITTPLGGSIKVNLEKGELFSVDKPAILFTKVK